MNWAKIKFFFLDAVIWLAAHWQVTAALAALIIVLLVVGQIQSCNSKRTEKKIEQTRENIAVGKVESNAAANQINAAANVSNQALENVNAAKNIDSGKQSNSFNDAMSGFCARFPNDSLCKK